MGTATKTNYLISEITTQVRQSFGKWCVGTSEQDDVWLRNKWAEMIVFNVGDSDATTAAYEYLVSAGMRPKKPIGKQARYLYLYCLDGMLPQGFIH